jgi:four helix bundle protein
MGQKRQDREYDLEDRLIDFAVAILETVEQRPDTRAGNHVAGQLVRCGTSPAPNYGEAEGAESRRDFVHKMKVAFKELRETRVWLRIARRRSLIPESSIDPALSECEELIRIFGKSIATAKAGHRGSSPSQT